MRVEDLRIGNYVKCHDEVFMIEWLQKTGIVGIVNPLTRKEEFVEMLRPISLDDMMLDKYLGKHSTNKDFYIGDIYHWDEYCISRNHDQEEYYFGTPCINSRDELEPYQEYEIQGLHHLQNIYHVLHGEELKIDLFK